MEKIINFFTILIGSILIGACSSPSSIYSEVFDPEGELATSLFLSRITDGNLEVIEEKYIYLKNVPEGFINRIGKVELYSDKLFLKTILDEGAIYCFDLDGNFQYKIADFGMGPNEYLEIRDFSLWDSALYVLESPNNQLFIYDIHNGTLISKSDALKDYPASEFEIYEGKIYLFSKDACKSAISGCFGLYIFDLISGNLDQKLHPFPFSKSNLGLNNGDYLSKSFDGVTYTFDFGSLFYHLGENNKIYNINAMDKPLYRGAYSILKNDMSRFVDEVLYSKNANFLTSISSPIRINNLQYCVLSFGSQSLYFFFDEKNQRYQLFDTWKFDPEGEYLNSIPIGGSGDYFISIMYDGMSESLLQDYDKLVLATPENKIEEIEAKFQSFISKLEPLRENPNPLIVLTKYHIGRGALKVNLSEINLK